MAAKSSGPAAPRRRHGPGRPFRKGQSGNPRGRRRGVPNKATVEVREVARRLVDDPDYQRMLRVRLRYGTAGPIESVLWYYAFGRPKETHELTGPGGGPIQTESTVNLKLLTTEELLAWRRLVAKAQAG